jgi:hypothetical protein
MWRPTIGCGWLGGFAWCRYCQESLDNPRCVTNIWAPHPFITISSAGNVNHTKAASDTTKRCGARAQPAQHSRQETEASVCQDMLRIAQRTLLIVTLCCGAAALPCRCCCIAGCLLAGCWIASSGRWTRAHAPTSTEHRQASAPQPRPQVLTR